MGVMMHDCSSCDLTIQRQVRYDLLQLCILVLKLFQRHRQVND